MAATHHAHLFSHKWFELHPKFGATLRAYGISWGALTLLASAVFLVVKLESELNVPLKLAMAVEPATGSSSAPAVAGGYLPDQFFAQAVRAPIEELPPQF